MQSFAIGWRSSMVATSIVVSLGGCANKRDVVIAKLHGKGADRVYPINVDQAWTISKTILELEPTETIEEHRAEAYMLTSSDPGAISPGTYLGVFFEPEGPRATKVTFVARRRTPTQAYAALDESSFHKKFGELLAMVAKVGPLYESGGQDAGTVEAGPPFASYPSALGDGGS